MATLPVRQLGAVGVVTDASPYSLPLNAFSSAINVLFDEGRVQRAPVFKTLYAAIRSNQPFDTSSDSFGSSPGTFENTLGSISKDQRFISSYSTSTNSAVIVCDVDGVVREYITGTLSVVTPGSLPLVTNSNPWTHAQIAGLSVLARKGMRPYLRNLATETSYGYVRGDWDTTHTCAVMRSYGDFLVALNVTKGTTEYPSMVKWCHPLQYSPDPSTGIIWNPADTTHLAGENPIGELRTPIRDGIALGRSFIIYSQDQVWLMDYTGSSQVFNFRKIFNTGGIINTNCVVELESKHYVFGEEDIYVHDGMSARSLADERVRKNIYDNIDRTKRDSFFVHHDTVLNLLYFGYVTKESTVGFPNTAYCNKAAVYNYRNNTWTFLDLPNICGGAETTLTLAQAGMSLSSTAVTPRVSVMLGVTDVANGLTESRVYAVDTPDVGVVKASANPETVKRCAVVRTGIDLDAEANFDLRTYKVIKALLPQVVFSNTTGNLTFQIGASDTIDGDITWQDPQVFDHRADYKVDTRASGRYLALKVYSDTADFFRFAGYDVEIIKVARR